MTSYNPHKSPTGLQWNAGGWFGGQLGGTCWMLVAAVLISIKDLSTGAIVFVLFLVPNLLGTYLWSQRAKIEVYPAMQILLLVLGGVSMATVYVLERRAHWEAMQSGAVVRSSSMYLLIPCLIGGLMLMFYLQHRRGRKKRGPQNNI